MPWGDFVYIEEGEGRTPKVTAAPLQALPSLPPKTKERTGLLVFLFAVPLRRTIVNRTYDTHIKTYVSLFLPTIFGPMYYGPP